MSNISNYPNDQLAKGRNNGAVWAVIAAVVLIAFFVMWSMNHNGPAARINMGEPRSNSPVTAPLSP